VPGGAPGCAPAGAPGAGGVWAGGFWPGVWPGGVWLGGVWLGGVWAGAGCDGGAWGWVPPDCASIGITDAPMSAAVSRRARSEPQDMDFSPGV